MSKPSTYFLICGLGKGWKFAPSRLARQIRNIKPEAQILIVNEKTLKFVSPSAQGLIDELGGSSTLGYGYWLWKPIIIHDVLESLESEATLFYIDAGCEINAKGLPRLEHYLAVLNLQSHLLFSLPDDAINYIGRSVADYFELNESDLLGCTMTLAGFMAFKKKNGVLPSVLDAWYQTALKHPNLFTGRLDRNLESNPNFKFRYDQSVLSALAIKNNLDPLPNEIDTLESKTQKSDYFVLALRNRAPFSVAPGSLGFKLRLQYWNVTGFIHKLFRDNHSKL